MKWQSERQAREFFKAHSKDFDYKLHKSYVDYFANQNSKRDILADLENLFKHFDKNFKELA